MDRYVLGLVFWVNELRASVALSGHSQRSSYLNRLESTTSERRLQKHRHCGSNGDEIRDGRECYIVIVALLPHEIFTNIW